MMKNKYSEYILKMLRQRRNLEEDDTSKDEELNKMSPSTAFAEVCSWEGLNSYDHTIKGWIKDIYGFNIDEVESK